MASLRKGLIVALLHLLIVSSLGAKLLVDRATRPRAWARTMPFDPDLPLRGRYVRLRVEGRAGDGWETSTGSAAVSLSVRDGLLELVPASSDTGLTGHLFPGGGPRTAVLDQPVAYFIPEHVPDPSQRPPGEELWVEVTLPRHGGPRPIRLAVKKDGVLTPLPLD